MMFNIASGSAGYRFYVNNVLKGTIDTGGYYWAGSSNFGPTSAKVNGTLTVGTSNGTWDGNAIKAGTSNLYLNANGAGNAVYINYNTGYTSGLGVYGDGSSTNRSLLNGTSLTFSGASTSYYSSGDAAVYGNLIMPNQAAGQCAQFDGSHHLVAAGGACGLASGSITSVTGTAPITATTSSGAVTVGISATPAFNSATLGTTTTGGTLYLGTDGLLGLTRSGSAITFSGTAGSTATITANGGLISGSSNFFPSYISENGPVTATQFNGSGAGLTAGTVPNNALVTAPLTALTCSVNVTCGTGTTPTVQLVTAPSFSGAVTASQFNGSGAGLTSGTVPNAALVTPAVTGVTCSANVVCGTGVTPTVQVTAAPSFSGMVTAGSLSTNGTLDLMGGSGANSDVTLGRDGGAVQGLNFNVPTGSTYGYRFLVNGSRKAQIDANGTYTVGSSSWGATSATLNGTFNYPAAGTATSTNNYGAVGGAAYQGSIWNGTSATPVSETLGFNVGDCSTCGLTLTGQASSGTNSLQLSLSGERPALNFNSTQQSTAQWSIIEGDAGGFTSGDLVFFDRTNSCQCLVLDPANATFSGQVAANNGLYETTSASSITLGGDGVASSGNAYIEAGSPNFAANATTLNITGKGAAAVPTLNLVATKTIASSELCIYSCGTNAIAVGDLALQRQGSPSTAAIFFGNAGSNYLYYNGSGWVMNAGNGLTATAFFNASKREWKHDISRIDSWDVFDMLPNMYRYHYNKGHGDDGKEWRLGYMADGPDGANTLLAGVKRDHEDVLNLVALDTVAVKQLNARVKRLESRQALGAGVVVNGTTHDPRVDALQVQVKWLWIALIALSLLVLLILAALILAVKYLVAVL
jgi:hypothetical protein